MGEEKERGIYDFPSFDWGENRKGRGKKMGMVGIFPGPPILFLPNWGENGHEK